jgi:hypothetical protein
VINGIIKRLRAKREAETATAALIARRAQRTANRRADVVAAYERKHTILARGK